MGSDSSKTTGFAAKKGHFQPEKGGFGRKNRFSGEFCIKNGKKLEEKTGKWARKVYVLKKERKKKKKKKKSKKKKKNF
jgi:hypothetical protein